jgi:hypothetical protein
MGCSEGILSVFIKRLKVENAERSEVKTSVEYIIMN